MEFVEKNIKFYQNQFFYNKKKDLVCSQVSKNFKFNSYLDKPIYQTVNKWIDNGYLYENDIALFLLNVLKKDDISIDIGANFGIHTLLMASIVGESGKVLSFEPGNESFKELSKNIKLNKFNNVIIKNEAIGDSNNKKVRFNDDKLNAGHSCIISSKKNKVQTREIIINSLDSHVKMFSNIKVVKIDVEGYEKHVLDGCKRLLTKNMVRYWIVEYAPHCLAEHGSSLDKIKKLMKKHGYDMFILDPSCSLPKFIPTNTTIHSRVVANLLFTKLDYLNEDWLFEDVTDHVFPTNIL